MQQLLVSILIPFKNTAKFLSECLDSVMAQSYQNWEVLAVNDNSKDSSQAIVTAFSKKDPRIQLHTNNGNGIIEALRTGYSFSRGDLITRMDSDDIMVPQKLEVMVNAMQKNGKGHIAIGQVKYFSARGTSDGYFRYEKWLNALTAKGNNYSEIYKECVVPSPCWMVYGTDLDACGAFEPNRYPEDYDLTFRFYERRLKCIPCSEVLHLWRDYDTRTSRTSEHYAQNYFLDIKLRYFLKLDRDQHRPLTVWGAGTKGKTIAQKLLESEIDFHWLCDNPKKIGKKIYGNDMVHYKFLEQLIHPQSIVTVANEKAQKMIRGYFKNLGQAATNNYFFFC